MSTATKARPRTTMQTWKPCPAVAGGEIGEENCQILSRRTVTASAHCIPTKCQCPWRHGAKKSESKAALPVARPAASSMRIIPPTRRDLAEVMAAAKAALEDKRYLTVNPRECVRFPDGHGQPRHKGSITEHQIESMESSLKEIGQIHPCLVRENSSGSYELISGETRWLASLRIPKFRLQVLVVRFDNLRIIPFILACVANGNTSKLKPLEMCDAICRLVYEESLPMATIAKEVFGIPLHRAYEYLRLEQLSADGRARLACGEISMAQALELVKHHHSAQPVEAERMIANKRIASLPDPLPRNERTIGRPVRHVGARKSPSDRFETFIDRLEASAKALVRLGEEMRIPELLESRPALRAELKKQLERAEANLAKAKKMLGK